MRKSNDEPYLRHILESREYLLQHDQTRKSLGIVVWHEHVTIRESVLRTLQTMSESCQRLSPAAKDETNSLPWHKINGFRNVIVHDYLGDIRLDQVTEILNDELPHLFAQIETYLRKHYGDA